MSIPFGLDFGNMNSVLAVARNRGIDIVVNEVSNRSTPSIVGFGEKNRYIGESGKNKQGSNIKNTVENLKRIIGLNFDDKDLQNELKYFNSKVVKLSDNKVGSEVTSNGDIAQFSATQIAAMFLGKLKNTVEIETKSPVSDICIAVPAWYNEEQRYAIADAAKISGLNPVRIINEVTAAAVSYGVFKTDLPEGEEKPRIVALVDIGHSSYTCSIVAFKKGECKILGTAYDKNFGGRDFDYAIANHFADEFDDKYKLNIRENAKAFHRLVVAAEKLKKVLSANTVAPFNIESLMNDLDFSSQLKREDLEQLVQPLLDRVTEPVTRALAQANVTVSDIDFVEIIGGTTRIPVLKNSISEAFNKEISATLNQDEAVAKGAAFVCAIHSPTLRVRPFKFEDIHPYSVSYYWDQQVEDEGSLEVFPRNSNFPSTKLITLHRTGDFSMEAKYTNPEELPEGITADIASWDITGVKLNEGQESIEVKIKLRCDPSGLHTIEDAYSVEEIITKEEIPLPDDAAEDAEPEYKEVKNIVKKDTLSIIPHTFALNSDELNSLIEKENELVAQDKLVYETEERMNQLEEYIYSLRSKLSEQYADFASDEEKQTLTELLTKAEDWLYDEGLDTTKANYIAKYDELAALGDVIKGRYLAKEEEKRQAILAEQEAIKKQKEAEAEAAKAKEASEKAESEDAEVSETPEANTEGASDGDGDVEMD